MGENQETKLFRKVCRVVIYRLLQSPRTFVPRCGGFKVIEPRSPFRHVREREWPNISIGLTLLGFVR